VEKMEPFEEVKGGLRGLVMGEVLEAEQHPNADKLRLTKVTLGGEPCRLFAVHPTWPKAKKWW
jgi:phenylalanyl-tRNA synthetase beta chain